MTPQELESKWTAFENHLISWLASQNEFFRWLSLPILAGFFYLLLWPDWTVVYPGWTRLSLAQDRLWLVIILLFFSLLVKYLSKEKLVIYFGFCILATWTFSCWKLQVIFPGVFLHPLFLILMTFGFRVMLKSGTQTSKILTLIFLLLGFASSMYISGYVALNNNPRYLPFFWTLHPEYLLFSGLAILISAWTGQKTNAIYFLAPTQVVYPTPLPAGTEFKPTSILWWHGFVNLVFALILLKLLFVLAFLPAFQITILNQIHHYLFFCLFIISGMNFTSSLLRMYGFNVMDATSFLFLANSPLDFWRRASNYLYHFMFENIFIPSFRKFRSLVLSVAICVFAIGTQMFLFHEVFVRWFYSFFFPEFTANIQPIGGTLVWVAKYLFLWLTLSFIYQKTIYNFYLKRQLIGNSWVLPVLTQILIVAVSLLYI